MRDGVHFADGPDLDNVARIDHGAMPMIAAMHRYGIRIDLPFLRSLETKVSVQQAEIESQIHLAIGAGYQDFNGKVRVPFNVGSPDHCARLLFHHLKVQGDQPVPMTKKGKRESTDDETIGMFHTAHPVCDLILEWRERDKLLGTYIRPIQRKVDSNSYLHTELTVTTAATGRLSSKNPNLQNIPVRTSLGREVRMAFVASPGCVLVSTDLSQIEMRWAAHRSQDPTMLSVFQKGEDIHSRTTCNVFGLDYGHIAELTRRVETKTASVDEVKEYKHFKQFQRLPCKTVGFGVLYGQTAQGLQSSLATEGVDWTLEECEDLIQNKFFGVYPRLRDMLERDHSTARRYALIWDDFGRVRLVPEAKSCHRRIREEGIRKAGNHPEQAGAQGTEKLGMAGLWPLMEDINQDVQCRPVLQIHDDCLSDVHRSIADDYAQLARYEFEHASPLDGVPVLSSISIGERWGEL
jgi:DNA polymerase-1